MENRNVIGPKANLGTFSGVFTPSVLTILGIILFLRLGFVVGSAGLANALIIIAVANLISVLTSFSLAAIATNMKVKGGGDYYLISRTLGLEFGGAIGIVLYLAQSVSIGFYCIGFGEAVAAISVKYGVVLSAQLIAFGAMVFLFVLAWAGADLATKFQYLVMGFLILALVSFYTGGIQQWDSKLLAANFQTRGNGPPFWILFALFFPAVTGFTQGVSMSGDLKSPGNSLPSGTFWAVFISIVVYFTVALVFAASNPLDTLASDYGAMKKTAAWGALIDAGVISATLSSAMASFLGAPRILQSLAADKIFSWLNPFAKGAGAANNPRRAVMLSLGIAVSVVALGELDLIARVVSMFFLISYGLLNYATWFEAGTDSPSFRPRFKWYHRSVSLAGFAACAAVMFAIDLKTGIAAAAVLFAIFQYLKHAQIQARWSDSRRSHHLKQVRKSLLAAQADLDHPRQWRPNILALSGMGDHFERLLLFSRWIDGGGGITTAVRVALGAGFWMDRARAGYQTQLSRLIEQGGYQAFPLVVSGVDGEGTMATLLQAYGVGPVRANTLVFDFEEVFGSAYVQAGAPRFKNHLGRIQKCGCNQIFISPQTGLEQPGLNASDKVIDVWWQADDSSRLILLLAYLCTRDKQFSSARIRLFAVHFDRENESVIAELSDMLEEVRIEAEPRIVLGLDVETVRRLSGDADLVFFPASLMNGCLKVLDRFDPQELFGFLKMAAVAVAGSPIDLSADPEEGPVQELTQVYDELAHAVKRAELAQKAAQRAGEKAQTLLGEIKKSNRQGPGPDVEKKVKMMIEASTDAAQKKQKALKEKAKLKAAQKAALDKGIDLAPSSALPDDQKE